MNYSVNDNLPRGWIWTTLEEVTVPKVTQVPPEGDGEFVYVDISSIDNFSKKIVSPKVLPTTQTPNRARQRIQPGDVLVSMTRPNLNAVALVPENLEGAIGSTGFHVLRSNYVMTEWLFYLVQSNAFVSAMTSLVQGVLYPAVRPKDVVVFRIPLAPLPEQHRIVAEIETQFTRLDVVVTAFKRVQANFKRYRASVLQAACEGRLVPTEAELARVEGRTYESADQLLQRILQERRAKWESEQLANMQAEGKVPKDDRWKSKYREPAKPDTSELPELPEGWMWVTWDQIGFSQNGRSFPSSEYQPSGFKLLRPGNLVSNGKIVWDAENTRYLPIQWAQDYPTYIVGPRELVINLTAQSLKDEFLGRVCLTGDSEECLLNQRIARLTPIEIMPEYLQWMFKSRVFRRFVDGLNKGSLIQHMFTSQLVSFTLPLPPLDEQQRIVAEVERRLSVIDELETTIATNLKRADRLRQAILRRAFEGNLVPQDPTDESASVLLERIRLERERPTEKPKVTPQQTNAPQLTAQPKTATPVQGELALGFRA